MRKFAATEALDSILAPLSSSAPIHKLVSEFINHPILKSTLALAPASSCLRYHHAYEGGLLDHIVDVFKFMKLMHEGGIGKTYNLTIESCALVALLHDIHKVADAFGNLYYIPNISEKTGKRSEKEPYKHNDSYHVDLASDSYAATLGWSDEQRKYASFIVQRMIETGRPLCGGDCSLALVYALSPGLYKCLSPMEIFAIRYHDGAYEASKFDPEFQGKENPLMILAHAADMFSSRHERNTNPIT
jgi:hypothetical protein